MAVKVMWARALGPREQDEKAAATERAALAAPPPAAERARAVKPVGDGKRSAPSEKPRRRRSSVFDAEGNEVFITLLCLKCRTVRPLSQFGLRRMADGAIRNQPWCRPCRSDASPRKRKEEALREDPAVSGDSPGAAAADRAPHDAGLLAAQVAAALHAGRR